MSWGLLAFDKHGDALAREILLPQVCRRAVIESFVGSWLNLKGDSFPSNEDNLERLTAAHGVDVDGDRYDYFVEYRA